MMAIGRYLLLIISLARTIFTINENFTEEEITRFLDYIYRLHNAVRIKHGVDILERTNEMDFVAYQKMCEWENVRDENDIELGLTLNHRYFDENSTIQLNIDEAIKIFSLSFELGNFYNYDSEPISGYYDEFTQILWSTTDQIGLAFRQEETRYRVVVVYFPRGNTEWQYTSNVNRPTHRYPAIDPDIEGLIYKTGVEIFFENILELHNQTRNKHRVERLIHDHEMDDIADSILRNREFTQERYGLNKQLFRIDHYTKLRDKAVANEVFSKWYYVHGYYTYIGEPEYNITDPFTRIVWSSTQKIGMSITMNFYSTIEFIVIYDPPGNIPGQFGSNVHSPINTNQ